MKPSTVPRRSPRVLGGILVCGALVGGSGAAVAGPLEEFLEAADAGACIEDVVYVKVRALGDGDAEQLVGDALDALAQRDQQQQALGCDGDIAAQAIAAGADPGAVLPATAAGL